MGEGAWAAEPRKNATAGPKAMPAAAVAGAAVAGGGAGRGGEVGGGVTTGKFAAAGRGEVKKVLPGGWGGGGRAGATAAALAAPGSACQEGGRGGGGSCRNGGLRGAVTGGGGAGAGAGEKDLQEVEVRSKGAEKEKVVLYAAYDMDGRKYCADDLRNRCALALLALFSKKKKLQTLTQNGSKHFAQTTCGSGMRFTALLLRFARFARVASAEVANTDAKLELVLVAATTRAAVKRPLALLALLVPEYQR